MGCEGSAARAPGSSWMPVPRVTQQFDALRWKMLGYARFERIDLTQTSGAALTQPTSFGPEPSASRRLLLGLPARTGARRRRLLGAGVDARPQRIHEID